MKKLYKVTMTQGDKALDRSWIVYVLADDPTTAEEAVKEANDDWDYHYKFVSNIELIATEGLYGDPLTVLIV